MAENAFVDAMNKANTQAAPAGGQAGTSSNPLPFNKDNLFGDPSAHQGGAFVPTPPLDVLVGRTLVYIPRTFDAAAKDPFDNEGKKTRKQWIADLYVIDGGDLRWWREKKGQNGEPSEIVEEIHEGTSPANPYVCPSTLVAQSAFVTKLSYFSEKRQLMMCTVTRGARKDARERGKTDEQLRADYAAWIARDKQGPEVKFVWLTADLEADAKQRVMEWYNLHADSINI